MTFLTHLIRYWGYVKIRSGLDKTREHVEIEKALGTLTRGQVEAWIISALEAVERCRSMERDELESKDIKKR